MSIFTPVSELELARYLESYDLGRLIRFAGIRAGIENTNYFVTTSTADLVLTLFEATPAADLPFFLELMAYLADHGLPCARPRADRAGSHLRTLNGRPAVLVSKLPGHQADRPSAAQLRAIGTALARLHQLTSAVPLTRANDRGPAWWNVTATRLDAKLTCAETALLREEIAVQLAAEDAALPHSVIHADLFRDNALFVGEVLTGIIDFYYACTGPHVYDLAITVNDWCIDADCVFDVDAARILLDAYQAGRPITPGERAAWPIMLRRAALRFWLSRLHDLYFPRSGVLIQQKSPDRFRLILEHHREHAAALATVWR